MSSMTIILTPATTRPCSAGSAHARRHSNRRKGAAGARSRSRPASANRHSCPSPAPPCSTACALLDAEQPPARPSPERAPPAPSTRSVATSFAWEGEQDMKVNLTPVHVAPASRGSQKGCSRPPSAATALHQHSRKSSSRGSARIARYRCVTERPQLGDSEPQFYQVWDLTRANEPSYMRHTRNSQISRGHSLAAYYNLKLLREKHNLLCGGKPGRQGRNRSSVPASPAPRTDSTIDDSEVISSEGGDPWPSDIHEAISESATEEVFIESSSTSPGGIQEETSEATAQQQHLQDSWNFKPSVASWLLQATPSQRLAAERAIELPAAHEAGLTFEQIPCGCKTEGLTWFMRPSVGTWLAKPLGGKSKELPSASRRVLISHQPFTSLSLRPLPSWFHMLPHPPLRPSGLAKLGPPPLPTCIKRVYLEGFAASQTESKDKQRLALQRQFTKSSSDLFRRSCMRHNSSRTSPRSRRRSQLQDVQPTCNASNAQLFESWCSTPCTNGQPISEGSCTRWHDVALTLVARQQLAQVQRLQAAPATKPHFACRPSVGTWIRKPIPGPAQIKALANVSAGATAAMTVNSQKGMNKLGCLALHYAARDGNPGAVQMILAARAEPGTTDERGVSPLHLAAEAGHDNIVRLLLHADASPHCATSSSSPGKTGITALHAAACCGQVSVAMRLLTAGASPAQARGDGVLPLHFAAQGGHVGVALVLLAAGSPVDQCGAGGFTPLHDSAHGGHADVVAALLAARADPDAATMGGTTPLHGAAQGGHVEVTRCLLVNGAEHSFASAGGFTPLHDAAHAGHKAIVRELIRARVSPNIRSAEGATPLHLAAQAGWTSIAAFLASRVSAHGPRQGSGPVASPRRLAASRGHIGVIRALRAGRCRQDLGTPY